MEEVEGRKAAAGGTTEQSGRGREWLMAASWQPRREQRNKRQGGREGGQWGITRVIAHLTQIVPPAIFFSS